MVDKSAEYRSQPVPIRDIFVVGERRAVHAKTVAAIAQSIKEIGLRTPITVRVVENVPDPETGEVLTSAFGIVTGKHRLEACHSLGWRDIPAIIRDCTEREAKLWEIDENLCRAELTPAERAACTAERKKLYEEEHPETKHGVSGGKARQGAASDNLSFAEDTAKATGQDKRTIQRDAARGKKIAPDVIAGITGSQWDKGVVLDMLKRLSHDEQRQALQRVQSGASPSFADAVQFIRGDEPERPAKAKPERITAPIGKIKPMERAAISEAQKEAGKNFLHALRLLNQLQYAPVDLAGMEWPENWRAAINNNAEYATAYLVDFSTSWKHKG